MSTQNPPAAGGVTLPFFKTEDELAAFMKRCVVEEAAAAAEKAIAPLSEKQMNLMKEMLDEHARGAAGPVLPKGHMFARIVRAMALARLDKGITGNSPEVIEAASKAVKKYWGDHDPVLKALDQSKALAEAGGTITKATAAQASDPASLGNLIAPQWSMEFIDLLRNRPVIRSIARVIPNPLGSLNLRRQTSAGTAYWVGEPAAITASKPGVGLMQFLRKKLAALTIASNDLLRFSVGPLSIPADQLILEDLLLVVAIAEDLAMIRSDGGQFQPRGLKNLIATANVFGQTGTTLTAIDADHAKAVRLVEEANIYAEPDTLHWLMVPRTYMGLWNAAPATDAGARPYRDGLQKIDGKAPQGRVLNNPVHKTNQIPKNLGVGSNETETYLAHGPSLMIADTLNLQVDIFPGGAYQDGNTVVSGISNDETPIRVLREMDFNMRYQEAGALITGVTIA